MPIAAIYQIETPFTEGHLRAISYEQTGDGLVLVVRGVHPQLLRRFGHADWRLEDAPIGTTATAPAAVDAVVTNPNNSESADGYVESPHQYAVSAVRELDGRESQVTDSSIINNDITVKGNFNTITPDAVAGTSEYRVYRKKNGSYGYIGTLLPPATDFVDDNILADFSDGPPTNHNPFADEEYPSAVTFHSRRTFYGRTLSKPSTVYGSQTDDLFNHDKSRPLRATDSIELNLVGKGINAIRHLLSLGELLALTGDGVLALKAGEGVLTPTSIESKVQGYRGVGDCRPATVDEVGFYTTARGQSIRTLGYSFERDGFKGNDLTVFSRHFFTSYKVLEMVWCEQPSCVMWCLRDDGQLLALTWMAEQEVWGWTLCYTNGVVESICRVSEDGRDVLYASIRREVGGVDHRYIERMADPKWIEETWEDQEEAIILDSAVTFYSEDKVSVLSRLWWLEGLTVTALADGFVHKDRTVVDGVMTPPIPNGGANRITVGLPYAAYIRTLPIVRDGGNGSTRGRKQSAANAIVSVLNTRGIKIGAGTDPDINLLYDAPIPRGVGAPPPLFTGLIDPLGLGAEDWKDAKVTVAQTQPLPMVIRSISPDIELGG